MPTSKKWGVNYNGHYILEGGTMTGQALLDDITPLPYIKGAQKRFSWNQFESNTTPGSYDFTPLITWLDRYHANGKKLRVLLMYKAFGVNNKAVPDYITKTPSQAGYDAQYTDSNGPWYGAYRWGGVGQAAALWIPAVADRFIAMLTAMAAAVDGHPALATVDMNETSMGSPSPALTTAQKQAFGTQMARILNETIPDFATTPLGWFVNFPVTAAMNILNYVPPELFASGGVLAGPDTWFHDVSLENGVIQKYFDAWAGGSPIIPRGPSVQNANYQHYNHDDQQPGGGADPIFRTDIDIRKLFNRVTETADTFNTSNITGGTKQPLHANYVAWSAMTWPIPGTSRVPYTELKALLASLTATGGQYAGSTTPGIDLTIPSKYETTPPSEVLPQLTASLATDSGVSNSDKITNVGTVNSSALASGASLQYRKGTDGAWSSSQPAVTPGSNTYYVRQTKTGIPPSAESAPLTFTYDNTPPTRLMAVIDDATILIAYDSEIDLCNTTGFKPVVGDVSLAVTGGSLPTRTGVFVNETGRNFRIDLGSNATAGASYTLSYTQNTGGTARLQDKAGNYAADFSNISLINITGTGTPAQIVTITGIPGVVASGGFTNLRNWTVSGTLSAGLSTGDQLQIDRRVGASGSWENIGYASVTGTNWTMAQSSESFPDGEVAYRGKVRRGIGSKVGPTSSEFVINVAAATTINPPTVIGGSFLFGIPVVITGTWTNTAGHTLTVGFNNVNYGVGTGIVVAGNNWTLTVNDVPSGTYSIAARVTDAAGNTALDEDNASVTVLYRLTKGALMLALRRINMTPPPAPFSPADLFGTLQGAWYDPSDLSTLFQDALATTPVTGVGDPVARINDKSGNGLHWYKQAEDAGSPGTLQQDSNGKYYIDFAGTDDGYITNNLTMVAGPMDMVAALNRDTTDQNVFFYGAHGGNAFAGAASTATSAPDGLSGTTSYIVDGATLSSPTRQTVNNAMTTTSKHTLEVRIGDTTSWDEFGFGYYFTGWPFNGRLYGCVLRANLSESERTQLRQWMIDKMGGVAESPAPPAPPPPPPANTLYVGPTATGNGLGGDWNNVLQWSTMTFLRNRTYYLKSGAYANRTLSTAVNGSEFITIRKATASDHGTDTGWSAAFATGPAEFGTENTGSPLTINSGYWMIDGGTRNESDWYDSAAYGFKINYANDGRCVDINGTNVNNIKIRRVYYNGCPVQTSNGKAPYAIDTEGLTNNATGHEYSHSLAYRGTNVWFVRMTTGTIIEYNATDAQWSRNTDVLVYHGELVNMYFNVFDLTFRYNKCRNSFSAGNGGTALIAICADNYAGAPKPAAFIYGNLFERFWTGDAAIGFGGNASYNGDGTNCRIYNNTFVDGGEFNNGIAFPDGSGNIIQNNIWINCNVGINAGASATVSHNAFSGSTSIGTNVQNGLTTSLFVNYASKDFRLATATTAGATLAAPYDKDMLGTTRGQSGWDRGAYEKV